MKFKLTTANLKRWKFIEDKRYELGICSSCLKKMISSLAEEENKK